MIIDFTLTGDGELLIKVGQKVNFNDPLMKSQHTEEVKVPLATILKVAPEKIFKYLKRFVGDTITKGELIAEKKGMIGATQYHSEHEGVMKEINHDEGFFTIEITSSEAKTKPAFFQGEIHHIEGNTISLKIDKCKEFMLKEAAHDFGGAFVQIPTSDFVSINEEQVKDKIIVTKKVQPYEQVKLDALGALGLITLHTSNQDTTIPTAIIKSIEDWEKITTIPFPYCIISKDNNKIYFYA